MGKLNFIKMGHSLLWWKGHCSFKQGHLSKNLREMRNLYRYLRGRTLQVEGKQRRAVALKSKVVDSQRRDQGGNCLDHVGSFKAR